MIVLIDNYDSFTYNLVQRIGEIDRRQVMKVYRNDQVTLEQIENDHPDRIIVSPGPCTPKEAGISVERDQAFRGQDADSGCVPGAPVDCVRLRWEIVRADRLMPGKTSEIRHDGKTIFAGLSNPFTATRYHSLVAEPESLPDCFEITARTADQPDREIMGIRHRTMPIEGVQSTPRASHG